MKIDQAMSTEAELLVRKTITRIRAIINGEILAKEKRASETNKEQETPVLAQETEISQVVTERKDRIVPKKIGRKGDRLFLSREIEDLRNVPKSKRARRIREIREDIKESQETRIRIEKLLVAAIMRNPDISTLELMKICDNETEKSLIDFGAYIVVESICDTYKEMHRAVKKYREKFPNDNDLFLALSGRRPVGEVQIIAGPMTLMIRCADIKDYALFADNTFLKDAQNDAASEEPSSSVQESIASFLSEARQDELKGTLLVEKVEDFSEESEVKSKSVLAHETEHAIQRLVEEVRFGSEEEMDEGYFSYEEYLKDARLVDEVTARNEILAYIVDGDLTREQIYDLFTREESDSSYNYLKRRRAQEIDILATAPEDVHQSLEREFYQDIYFRNIRNGLNAITQLEESGYDVEAIVSLLRYEPLAKWQKVVHRFLERPKS
ncbi:MAG: hypothetical protein WC776_00635 [Patescibacteria group bacterium]